MKKLILFFFVFKAFTLKAQNSFPVLTSPILSEFNFWRMIEAEGQAIPFYGFSNNSAGGGYDVSIGGSGSQTYQGFRNWTTNIPSGSITANGQVGMGLIAPNVGLKYIIKGVRASFTGVAGIYWDKAPYVATQPMMDGRTSFQSDNTNTTMYHDYEPPKSPSDTFGRSYKWDFTSAPISVPYGSSLAFSYYRPYTTKVGWIVSAEGYAVADDENFYAKNKLLVIGESTAKTAENFSNQDSMYVYMLKNQMQKDRYDVHLVNIGLGGTSSNEWEFLTRNSWQMEYNVTQNCRHLVTYIFLGINDRVANNPFCPSPGTDGVFKKNLKKIIQYIYDKRIARGDTADIIVGIGTNQTGNLTAYSGTNTYYTSQGWNITQVAQYEQLQTVSDLNTAGYKSVIAARTDLAFTSAEASLYTTDGTHLNNGFANPLYSGQGKAFRIGILPAYTTLKTWNHLIK